MHYWCLCQFLPYTPPARDNAARGCAGGTRPGGREDNANLQVRLVRETKGRAAFPLLGGEALAERVPGPWQCPEGCVARQGHREHSRDSDILPLGSDRAAQVT